MGDFLREQYDKQSCKHTVIISMYSSNEIEKVKELLEGNGYTVISYLLSNPSPNSFHSRSKRKMKPLTFKELN